MINSQRTAHEHCLTILNFFFVLEAPPRFSITPEDVIYVNLGDAIILNCQAEGTPTPEIFWYKDANPVEPSGTIGIFNDGTELRIATIRHEDIGDYTCIARNGEGQISHTARVIIAGEFDPFLFSIIIQVPISLSRFVLLYLSYRLCKIVEFRFLRQRERQIMSCKLYPKDAAPRGQTLTS